MTLPSDYRILDTCQNCRFVVDLLPYSENLFCGLKRPPNGYGRRFKKYMDRDRNWEESNLVSETGICSRHQKQGARDADPAS